MGIPITGAGLAQLEAEEGETGAEKQSIRNYDLIEVAT